MRQTRFEKKVYSPQNWRRGKKKKKETLSKKDSRALWYTGKKEKRAYARSFVRSLVSLGFMGVIVGAAGIAGVFAYVGKDIPNPGQILERDVPISTKIYDRTGEVLLYDIHGEEQRTLVTLGELPEYVAQATLMAEDKNFYNHPGFDLKGIVRAALGVATGRNRGGGSTITQQFIKNAILTNERTYTRKIKELILAYQIEKKFTKDQILEFYLNEIPYGSTAYGIEAAANMYFEKNADGLTLTEAATLASIPQMPKYYSPFSSSYDADRLLSRRNWVLESMVEAGYVSEEEFVLLKEWPLKFSARKEDIKAPHFVFWVKEQLEDEYGSRIVDQGGLKIITTLDIKKQEKAETAIEEFKENNQQRWNASNAALVAMDTKTGEVLAMVGSSDYFNDKIDGQVNVALSKRQPGSSIKPIVYAAAFDKGYTPETTLYDVETAFITNVGTAQNYTPKNYNGKFYGPVSMRKALQGSLNIPAVKTLYLVGLENAIEFAEKLGYSTFPDRSRFGLSFVLGGAEVILLEHVRAFAAFAREGEQPEIVSVLRVEDSQGEILKEFKESEKKQVMKSEVARTINDILSDNEARSYIFGTSSTLQLGDRPVAAKTGTTTDNKDAWILGYTPSVVVGVWTGNSDAKAMKTGADGSVVAGPIWNKFMHSILDGTPVEQFKESDPIPEDIPAVLRGQSVGEVTVKIDTATGRPANEFTPEDQIEEKKFIQHHSILHYIDTENPRGSTPTKPEDDPEYIGWEQGVKKWVQAQKIVEDVLPYDNPNISPENRPTIYFVRPSPDDVITSRVLSFDITAAAPLGVDRVDYFWGSKKIASVRQAPYDLENFALSNSFENGFYLARAVAYDAFGNYASAEVDINLNALKLPLTFSWQDPRDNASFYSSSLPITLVANISDPSDISEARFWRVRGDATSQPELFYTAFEVTSKTIEAVFGASTPPGMYEIYFEILFSDGSSQKSENLKVNILE